MSGLSVLWTVVGQDDRRLSGLVSKVERSRDISEKVRVYVDLFPKLDHLRSRKQDISFLLN